MYGMGQNPLEMPVILRGAAYRETLSPDQLSRLESQGIPTAKAGVNVSSVLPMLVVGGLAAWFLAGGTKRRTLWSYIGFLIFGAPMLTAQASAPVFGLQDAPVALTSHTELDTITATPIVFDSLRIVVIWGRPVDGLGDEDSTFFRIRATQTIRFMGGGTIGPETWRRRRHFPPRTADTLKVLRPAIGDSIIFMADSISQCRQGECSEPGGTAWGYKRTARPPSITFIQVTTDSF